MPQTFASGSATTVKTIAPGLAEADMGQITLTQGVAWEQRLCFVKSLKPFQIFETTASGVITANKADHCLAVGDKVRLINWDACTNDTLDSATVFPVASITTDPANPARDEIALTGATLANKTYEAAAATSTGFNFLGCNAAATATAEVAQSPYGIEACSGADMVISGGIWSRDDLADAWNVYAAAGSNKIYSNILGRLKVGDAIVAPGLGIDTCTLVQRVDVEQGTTDGKSTKREVYTIADVTTSASDCTPAYVRRGLTLRVEATADGDCFNVRIPEYETSKLQLSGAKSGNGYDIGTLLITAHYGRLNGAGQMQTAAVELMRRSVVLQPSHLFSC